jgi:hypothetical protein
VKEEEVQVTVQDLEEKEVSEEEVMTEHFRRARFSTCELDARKKDVKGSFEKITVRPPELRGTNLMNKHHVFQIASCTEGVNHFVFRRYRDFDWLRTHLVKLYPGICIPPLPPKKIAGSLGEGFVAERRMGVERFLNRVQDTWFMQQEPAFTAFLADNDDPHFENACKEFTKDIMTQTPQDVITRYNTMFPQLLATVNDEVIMDTATLTSYIDNIESKLSAVLTAADAMTSDVCLQISTTEKINIAMEDMYTIESSEHFPQLPNRLDLRRQFANWHKVNKLQAHTHHHYLARPFQQELWDVRAFLEAIKCRSDLVAKTTLEGGVDLLALVTAMVLGPQLRDFWELRMLSFRESMKNYAEEQLKLTEQQIDLWQDLHDTSSAYGEQE